MKVTIVIVVSRHEGEVCESTMQLRADEEGRNTAPLFLHMNRVDCNSVLLSVSCFLCRSGKHKQITIMKDNHPLVV